MNSQQTLWIRPYLEEDFATINELNRQQGWNNLVEKSKIHSKHGVTQR